MNDEDFLKLIRHHKIATVSFLEDQSESAVGLETHDIYIIEQAEEIEEDPAIENTEQMIMHLRK